MSHVSSYTKRADPGGLEPPTNRLRVGYCYQLSYRSKNHDCLPRQNECLADSNGLFHHSGRDLNPRSGATRRPTQTSSVVVYDSGIEPGVFRACTAASRCPYAQHHPWVDPRGIEPLQPQCECSVLPLSLRAQLSVRARL